MSPAASTAEASGKHAPQEEQGVPGWKPKLLIGAGLVLLFSVPVLLVLTSDRGPTPADQLTLALLRLDEGKNFQARELAKQLEEIDYHDPNFAGGTEFVLGIVAFREADGLDETAREQRYILAAAYLREAEQRAIIDPRKPEWAYALGVSLYRVGSALEARPLLEEAVESYAPGRTESSLLLADIYLYRKEPQVLQHALELNTTVIETLGLSTADLDRAYLQRAQILIALARHSEAEQSLSHVSDRTTGNHGSMVLRSQTYIADGKYQEALQLLEPVAKDAGLQQTYPRQAAYLMGVCAQKLGDPDAAIRYFERTAQVYERSHEALASCLWAGDLLREQGRDEEALEQYGQALRMVRRPESFRNRWLDIEAFRQAILTAWNDWITKQRFAEAIALSELMSPLFPRDQAYEFAARANQRWAEHLQAESEKLPNSQQLKWKEDLERRWIQSGQAYARLAQARKAAPDYPDAIWLSAEHFFKGHDFQKAVEEYTRFIETGKAKSLALAQVQRGRSLLNLGDTDAALEQFQQVVAQFPTDHASFEARYLVGVCHLQRRELDLAEKVWRSVLSWPDLSPKALEWQQSLFALGRLLYETGDAQLREAELLENQERTGEAEIARSAAFGRWSEAIASLDQYLQRYPDAASRYEARYMLAMAWQKSAVALERRFQVAETDNARIDLRSKIVARQEHALENFGQLQTDLRLLFEEDRLDELGQTMLRNCYFDLARTCFELGKYEEAISAYSSAANRYPLRSETLTAYVQMSNCYTRLGKAAESRSMLEQARIILKQIPDSAFQSPTTTMNRADWEHWLTWAMGVNPS
jgi:tetratricopeptide (TPR) repeat protein